MITRPSAGISAALARALARRGRLQPLETLSCVTAAVVLAMYAPRAGADEAAPVPTTPPVIADTEAQTTAANASSAVGAGGTSPLPEVTVTATRRAASAQNLPMSITAVSGQQLQASGIEDMGALAQSVAGVDFTDKGPFSGVAGANLIIRGLNADATAWLAGEATPIVPPVATYVDDTALAVNLRLLDLDRVEILRGPQGTLYGSGSLGGTVRYVQNAPDPSGFDARAEMGVSDTYHTHAPNEDVNGMVNLPITDTWAVRLNAGYSYDAGFINQPNLYVLNSQGAPVSAEPGNLFSPPVKYAEDGTNYYYYHSARIATLWKPNDAFQAQLNYYYQLGTAGGFPYVATSAAAYTHPISAATQPAGAFTNPPLELQLYPASVPAGADSLSNADNALSSTQDTVDLASLELEYDLGFATLTSASSWAYHRNQTSTDETGEYNNLYFFQDVYGQNPRDLVVGYEGFEDKPWAQEFRLVSKLGGVVDWVAGLFYRSETTEIVEDDFSPGYYNYYNACAPTYGTSPGDGVTPSYCGIGEPLYTPGATAYIDGFPNLRDQSYISAFETRFTDLAAYGELTGHLTSRWSVTGGTRVFRQTVSQGQQNLAFFLDSNTDETLSDQWRKVLWKLNTSYQLDGNNLVYMTWSQGFRRGGVNALPAVENVGIPPYVTPSALEKVAPDTADNYEVGAKGTLLGRLQYSADVFEIQWHNIQEGLDLTPLVLAGALNVGNGYSRGFEAELDTVFNRNWSATLDYTYDQTKLTSLNPLFTYPNSSSPPPPIGSALPGTPKNSLEVGPAYQIPLAGGELRFALNAHYQSSLVPELSATALTVPGYTMLGTRLSYSRTHWLATVYVDNVTNNLGITAYQDPALFGNRAQAIVSQPRTVGLTLGYSLR